MDYNIQKIAVVGAGTMGNGIAHVFAQYGYEVNLVDISPEALGKGFATISQNMDRQVKKDLLSEADKGAALKRLHLHTDLKTAVIDRDLVVEAATEKESLKMAIFRDLDVYTPEHAILASNTSSISITRMAAVTQRSGKVIGMHFMNPVPVMKLVEIIAGYNTQEEVKQAIMKLALGLGKTPVLSNDYPGFIANRILMPMINEAIYCLYEGVGDKEAIDTVMKLGMAHPMGPLQLADFIGLDVCLSIMEVLYEGFANPKYAPCPLLKNMVAAGHLGKKSGKGFYSY